MTQHYHEGYDAYQRGAQEDDNPYPDNRYAYDEWQHGFRTARNLQRWRDAA